jgi:hypothetical protein
MAEARPGALGHVQHRHRPRREHRPHEGGRLLGVPVGREPVVDRHHAFVGDDVPRHAAPDGDRVQALVVPQPVDLRLPGRVPAQHGEDVGRLVDRVAPHPGAGRVRAPARRGDLGAQRALAAALDHAGGRLHQHGEVPGQQLRMLAAQPQQPVALGRDLLAVVEHVGDVAGGRGEPRGEPELHRHPGLHVGRAAAEQPRPLGTGGNVARDRHRVDVPGQDDPFRPAELGPGHDRVAVPADGQVRQRPQRGLDGVRERPFLAADRWHVNQPRGQGRPVEIKVEVHRA